MLQAPGTADILLLITPCSRSHLLSVTAHSEGSEIRLIKFDNASRHTGGFSCQLEHVKLDENPVYFALSYVWGDETKTKRIIVNGYLFQVTENLHDALLQIRKHMPLLQRVVQTLDAQWVSWARILVGL